MSSSDYGKDAGEQEDMEEDDENGKKKSSLHTYVLQHMHTDYS